MRERKVAFFSNTHDSLIEKMTQYLQELLGNPGASMEVQHEDSYFYQFRINLGFEGPINIQFVNDVVINKKLLDLRNFLLSNELGDFKCILANTKEENYHLSFSIPKNFI